MSLLYVSKGDPLNLTCLSEGGYPEPTVDWYRRGAVPTKLSNCVSETHFDSAISIYNVSRACIHMPTEDDDGITFYCKSSYINEPFLIELTEVIVQLMCKYNDNTC